MVAETSFTFVNPKVLSISVNGHESDETFHAYWTVSYDETPDEESRVVLGTVHAGDENSQATVTIGGTFMSAVSEAQKLVGDELKDALAASYALETLYDVARMHARAALSLAEYDLEIPVKAPDAELTPFPTKDDNEGGEEDPPLSLGD